MSTYEVILHVVAILGGIGLLLSILVAIAIDN